MDAAFIYRMENVLSVYELPYNSEEPVICFDERPCFLIGDPVEPIPMKPGKVYKEDYCYEKNGCVALLGAIEPLTGTRFTEIYDQRTHKEYVYFLDYISSKYPSAKKIHLIQDNLNTHIKDNFYKIFPANKAKMLCDKFEFHYTPKHASWLNMMEIEFAAFVKQGLGQRIATKEKMKEIVSTLTLERNEKKIKINWQFTTQHAREKFEKAYSNVINSNQS